MEKEAECLYAMRSAPTEDEPPAARPRCAVSRVTGDRVPSINQSWAAVLFCLMFPGSCPVGCYCEEVGVWAHGELETDWTAAEVCSVPLAPNLSRLNLHLFFQIQWACQSSSHLIFAQVNFPYSDPLRERFRRPSRLRAVIPAR